MQNTPRSSRLNAFWVKPAVIFIMLLLLLIPVGFIKMLVYDRQYVKNAATQSIIEPMGGELSIDGLLLAVPIRFNNSQAITRDGKTEVVETTEMQEIIISPQFYSLKTEINPYSLKRGIFSVPVFNADVALNAKFKVMPQYLDESYMMLDQAILILGISNKNISAFPSLKIDGKELEQANTTAQASPFDRNIYFKIPREALEKGFEIEGNLAVQGGEKVSFTPLAKDNLFEIKSSWKSPSFSGGWLPKERNITDAGFSASWSIAGLSTNFAPAWNSSQKGGFSFERIETDFISPVNNYSLMLRCVTYALLFLAVPFLAIFVCEIYSRVRIHPVQYLLIGVADVLFYLLTLSFSEHISFWASYLVATIAVCLTVLLYAGAIFRGRKWGVFIALVQAISYCLLYGILQSENYALLLGSVMIFAVIALLMYLTRKIDWYENGANLKENLKENEADLQEKI